MEKLRFVVGCSACVVVLAAALGCRSTTHHIAVRNATDADASVYDASDGGPRLWMSPGTGGELLVNKGNPLQIEQGPEVRFDDGFFWVVNRSDTAVSVTAPGKARNAVVRPGSRVALRDGGVFTVDGIEFWVAR